MSLSPSHAPSSLPGRPCCRIKADPGLSVEPKASAAGPPEAVEDKRAISGEPEAATAGQQQHHYGWPLSWGAAEEQRLGGLGQQGRLPPPPLSVFVCVCVCVCVWPCAARPQSLRPRICGSQWDATAAAAAAAPRRRHYVSAGVTL